MEQIKYFGYVAEEAQWNRAFTVHVNGQPWGNDTPVTVIKHSGKVHETVYPKEHVMELLYGLNKINPLTEEQHEYLRYLFIEL